MTKYKILFIGLIIILFNFSVSFGYNISQDDIKKSIDLTGLDIKDLCNVDGINSIEVKINKWHQIDHGTKIFTNDETKNEIQSKNSVFIELFDNTDFKISFKMAYFKNDTNAILALSDHIGSYFDYGKEIKSLFSGTKTHDKFIGHSVIYFDKGAEMVFTHKNVSCILVAYHLNRKKLIEDDFILIDNVIMSIIRIINLSIK